MRKDKHGPRIIRDYINVRTFTYWQALYRYNSQMFTRWLILLPFLLNGHIYVILCELSLGVLCCFVLFCVAFKLQPDWKVKTILGLCTKWYLKMGFFVFDKLEKYSHKCDTKTGFLSLWLKKLGSVWWRWWCKWSSLALKIQKNAVLRAK
jgi:hypothetical protein